MRVILALAALFALVSCGTSPTEPAALSRIAPGGPVDPTPTPTPPLALGPLQGVLVKPTPCFPNPYTNCGVPETWPTQIGRAHV